MNKIAWTLNRLRCMGPAEIDYRVKAKLSANAERLGVGLAAKVPSQCRHESLRWISPDVDDLDPDPYLQRARRVLDGRYQVFAKKDLALGFPPRWNRDPKTGREAPLRFGKTLNYRDEALVGDVKYLWEINRHRELLWLAQAWHLSDDEIYLKGVAELLTSWFEQSPYPLGINWTSSLEHSVRLINWAGAWSLIGGDQSPLFVGEDGAKLRTRWLASIYQHLHFIAGHFSLYSSANNHLVGEYAGLLVGTTVWPLWPKCDRWQRIAKDGLEREIHRQIFADGFNREQAVWYHHEVAELFLIAALVTQSAGGEFSRAYWGQVEAMIDALALLVDCNGQVPALGDADDAVYLELGLEADVYRNLLATGAVLFDRADLGKLANTMPDRVKWLLGHRAAGNFENLSRSKERDSALPALPEAGYFLLGKRFQEPDEVRVLLDAGELGFLSIAAHGHADALALLLSVAGREILVDPGTYTYNSEPEWRSYFRGTAAHNTVQVDNQDQSVQAGSFIWLAHAEAHCIEHRQIGRQQLWKGEHSGYCRLKDPVVHSRTVVYDQETDSIEVTDELSCSDTHSVAIHWHVGGKCDVHRRFDVWHIESGAVRATLAMSDKRLTMSSHRGEVDPPLGWGSSSFDVREPITTLRYAGTITGDTTLRTRITVSKDHDRTGKSA
ncbi:MAG: alginate lyase family protein [Pseudomonadota bacterium]